VIKAEFLASLIQISVSHDPSEICWFNAKKNIYSFWKSFTILG